jgi:hypothetical protein
MHAFDKSAKIAGSDKISQISAARARHAALALGYLALVAKGISGAA